MELLTSNDTYFSDSWFSSIKTSEEVMAVGVDYCGTVKTSHKCFCLATLENLMKNWPGGSYLVMKSTTRFPGGISLMDIGYTYNSRKVLGFIATDGSGSTKPGDPYLSCFPDIFSIVSVIPVVRPHFLCRYFNARNKIDNHSMIGQYDLALDKYCVIQSGNFRLATAVALGMGIAYGKLLFCNGISEGNVVNIFSKRE